MSGRFLPVAKGSYRPMADALSILHNMPTYGIFRRRLDP
jgi:hypothetical protein